MAAIVGTLLGSIYACAEKTFAPGAAGSGLVRLSIMAAISRQVSPVSRIIDVVVGYDRSGGEFVQLLEQSTSATAGDSVQIAIAVDVSSCLADPNRGAAANVCPLQVLVRLKDAAGATLDSSAAGPVEATPGKTPALLTVTITATAAVAVTPAAKTLAPGGSVQLAAVATDASGNVLARAIRWSSSNTAVATVSASGLVTAVAPGTATITAANGNAIGMSAISVWQVTSVAVTPSAATLRMGAQATLTATVVAAAPTPTTVTWTTSDATKVSVSAAGVVTAVAAPGANVCATSTADATKSACAIITVLPPVITSIVRQAQFPLADSLPPASFPRGGVYRAVISGRSLAGAGVITFSDSAVTGRVVSRTDSALTIDLGSNKVAAGDSASAPIPSVRFALALPSGQVNSGTVAVSIVAGPAPQVLSFVALNGVTSVPAGQTTVVQFQGETLNAGNVAFWLLGSAGAGTSLAVTNISPGHDAVSFSVSWTLAPGATGTVSVTFGIGDGAGHIAQKQILLPIH